jgi:hypothetical protein
MESAWWFAEKMVKKTQTVWLENQSWKTVAFVWGRLQVRAIFGGIEGVWGTLRWCCAPLTYPWSVFEIKIGFFTVRKFFTAMPCLEGC